ncbi:MAG: NADH-quinone oxidoreductase subunit N, partial [Thermoplasmata archaeon]|nr:NADH-quinone oxidoreductase subunit N [Thermoplasmata archaeon]
FMKSGAFIIVAMVSVLMIGTKVSDLRGLRVKLPITAFCMAIMMLSLAGIPPLGGFASKFVLFSSAIDAGGWLIWLAVIAVINSAISLYYYARVLKEMYVLPVGVVERMKEPRAMLIPIVIATLAVIVIGLWPGPFVDAAMDAARALMP